VFEVLRFAGKMSVLANADYFAPRLERVDWNADRRRNILVRAGRPRH
jgi:hypothetical protein